jgi:hypothetical protein
VSELFAALGHMWWIRLPSIVARRSHSLADRLTDGIYLVGWPVIGALAPLVAGLAGLIAPTIHGPAITSSRLAMAMVAVAGTFGAGLGAWVTAGYVIGYYLWAEPVTNFNPTFVERWLGAPGSFLQAVLLVWLLAATGAIIALGVRLDLRARGWERRLGPPVTAIAYLATVGAVTYFITKAMPILVRPVFVWNGDQPRAEAVVPIQTDWWVVVVSAMAAAVLRLWLERLAPTEPVARAVREVSGALGASQGAGSPRVRAGLALAGSALVVTFLLAPLFENVAQAAIVFMVVMAMLAGRAVLARLPQVRSMAAVPLVVRYGAAIIASWFATDFVLGFQASNDRFRTDSFVIALSAVIASLAIFMVATAPVAPVDSPGRGAS